MKKYFSNIRTLAALLMAGAAFAACSSDENVVEQPANPTAPKTYTLTVNASKGDAATRALALDGTKLVASWANGDQLSVFNKTKVAALTGTLTASNANGATATFSGSLSGTIEKDDELTLSYHQPTGFSDYADQDGTLASAAARDFATATVTVASVEGGEITTTGDADFETQTAVLKLTLKDNATTPNQLNATQLKLSAAMTVKIGDLSVPMAADIATFNLSSECNGVVYFALPPLAGVVGYVYNKIKTEYPAYAALVTEDAVADGLSTADLIYTATVGSDTYTATKPGGYRFVAANYYAGTLTMYPMAANARSTDLGKLICTDGHMHADGADAGCTKVRVAKITYVGNDAETSESNTTFKHGLALALQDAGHAAFCNQTSAACFANGHQYGSGNLSNDLSGIANTDALLNNTSHSHDAAKLARGYKYDNGVAEGAHPYGTSEWFLPSAGQWNKMMDAAGGYSSYSSLASNAGLSLSGDDGYYWASTEVGVAEAWRYFFRDGNWYSVAKTSGSNRLIRACLAF